MAQETKAKEGIQYVHIIQQKKTKSGLEPRTPGCRENICYPVPRDVHRKQSSENRALESQAKFYMICMSKVPYLQVLFYIF